MSACERIEEQPTPSVHVEGTVASVKCESFPLADGRIFERTTLEVDAGPCGALFVVCGGRVREDFPDARVRVGLRVPTASSRAFSDVAVLGKIRRVDPEFGALVVSFESGFGVTLLRVPVRDVPIGLFQSEIVEMFVDLIEGGVR